MHKQVALSECNFIVQSYISLSLEQSGARQDKPQDIHVAPLAQIESIFSRANKFQK